MPITDPLKKSIAQKARLHFKVCFSCGAKNPISASRCQKVPQCIPQTKEQNTWN